MVKEEPNVENFTYTSSIRSGQLTRHMKSHDTVIVVAQATISFIYGKVSNIVFSNEEARKDIPKYSVNHHFYWQFLV